MKAAQIFVFTTHMLKSSQEHMTLKSTCFGARGRKIMARHLYHHMKAVFFLFASFVQNSSDKNLSESG
jgi:hypothetical protein